MQAVHNRDISVALACRTFGISETCYWYGRKRDNETEEITDWLLRLTAAHKAWGFGLCFLYLRNIKGFTWNHKRVYRIYRAIPAKVGTGFARGIASKQRDRAF